jgi:hypothetical protein
MKLGQLKVKIRTAAERLAAAEESMAAALGKVEPYSPGDKRMINDVLRGAFAELSQARRELVDLQDLLPEDT